MLASAPTAFAVSAYIREVLFIPASEDIRGRSVPAGSPFRQGVRSPQPASSPRKIRRYRCRDLSTRLPLPRGGSFHPATVAPQGPGRREYEAPVGAGLPLPPRGRREARRSGVGR